MGKSWREESVLPKSDPIFPENWMDGGTLKREFIEGEKRTERRKKRKKIEEKSQETSSSGVRSAPERWRPGSHPRYDRKLPKRA